MTKAPVSTKYFFDTEFIEDGRTIDLLSIGIVAEDGREFYAENSTCDLSRASAWVKDNVIPHLGHSRGGYETYWVTPGTMATLIHGFIDAEGRGKPEFWGYYADYDWVVLCQLFGTMMDLPKGWPMYCRDIKQWADDLGNPKLPAEGKDEHHALADARWNRRAWEFLKEVANGAQALHRP